MIRLIWQGWWNYQTGNLKQLRLYTKGSNGKCGQHARTDGQCKQMGILRKNQKEMLEIKTTTTE